MHLRVVWASCGEQRAVWIDRVSSADRSGEHCSWEQDHLLRTTPSLANGPTVGNCTRLTLPNTTSGGPQCWPIVSIAPGASSVPLWLAAVVRMCFASVPPKPSFRIDPDLFRMLFLARLRVLLPVTAARCESGAALDCKERHRGRTPARRERREAQSWVDMTIAVPACCWHASSWSGRGGRYRVQRGTSGQGMNSYTMLFRGARCRLVVVALETGVGGAWKQWSSMITWLQDEHEMLHPRFNGPVSSLGGACGRACSPFLGEDPSPVPQWHRPHCPTLSRALTLACPIWLTSSVRRALSWSVQCNRVTD